MWLIIQEKIMPIEKILYSIDNLLIEGKEQKLKGKLAKKLRIVFLQKRYYLSFMNVILQG